MEGNFGVPLTDAVKGVAGEDSRLRGLGVRGHRIGELQRVHGGMDRAPDLVGQCTIGQRLCQMDAAGSARHVAAKELSPVEVRARPVPPATSVRLMLIERDQW